MSYESALEAAGAEVHDTEFFGDWQGTWIARVTYNGTTGFIEGSFGSCSGCDSFQAEFDFSENCREHRYTGSEPGTCVNCDKAKEVYGIRLKSFGELYLDDIMTAEQVRERHKEDMEWDTDARAILVWLEKFDTGVN